VKRFEFVTFDCYGTLVDWERGISGAFLAAASIEGVQLERAEVLAAYMKIEPIVEAGPYRPYREVLRETAKRVARHLGWTIDDATADFLPESLESWPLFPDMRPALERLKSAGYRLGILSNVDVDLLEATLARLGVEFEVVVTAQQVGSYKPAHAHFEEAGRRVGKAGWLHAAQSYFHDVVPASELQIPVAWVNRHGEAPRGDARPDHEFRDLEQLADWLV
jgi:2-haloalkanoic acid dehalogenase type II